MEWPSPKMSAKPRSSFGVDEWASEAPHGRCPEPQRRKPPEVLNPKKKRSFRIPEAGEVESAFSPGSRSALTRPCLASCLRSWPGLMPIKALMGSC